MNRYPAGSAWIWDSAPRKTRVPGVTLYDRFFAFLRYPVVVDGVAWDAYEVYILYLPVAVFALSFNS
jgi:hypothetical protein